MAVQIASGSLVAMVVLAMVQSQGHAEEDRPATSRVFDVLDLSQPGLADVKRLHDAGEDEAACAALHTYIRDLKWEGRSPGREAMPARRRQDHSDPVADDLLGNTFNLGPFKVCWGPAISDIQWYDPPMDVIDDVHLFYGGRSMTRHDAFMRNAALAYWHTRDEHFASKLAEIVLDFIERCPIVDSHGIGDNQLRRTSADEDGDGKPDRPGASVGMVWQPFNIGRRVETWKSMFVFCRDSRSFTAHTWCEILCSIDEQLSSLVEKLPAMRNASNHTTRMGQAILGMCAFWPEMVRAQEWRRVTIGKLGEAYNWFSEGGFIYPDGALTEIKVSQGEVGAVATVIETARRNGIPIPPNMLTVHERMSEFATAMLWPDQTHSGKYAEMGRRVAALHDRQDLLHIASGGADGRMPNFVSWPPQSGEPSYAGTYFMRSDWSADAMVLRTRFGPMRYSSPSRGSGSMGEISLFAHSLHLIPFIGHSEYRGEFRDYGNAGFLGDGRSRNTVSVDGVGQTRHGRAREAEAPMENSWVTSPVFDYLRGDYTFDPAALNNTRIEHTRSILFARPDYYLVIDRLTSNDEGGHEYRMKYQLHRLLSPRKESMRVTAVCDAGGIVVDPLHTGMTLDIVKGQKEPYYEGWHFSRGFKPAPALIYTWRATGTSQVQTLLYPVGADPDNPRQIRASSERAGDGAVAVTITGHRPDAADYVLISGENGECRVGGYVLEGGLAFVRESAGDMVAAGMVEGVALKGDRNVFAFDTPTSAWARRQADGTLRTSTGQGGQ